MSHAQPGFLRRLFGGLWGAITWLRTSIANLIFIVIIVFIIVVVSSEEQFVIPDKTALVVAPQGYLVDQLTYVDPMSRLLNDDSGPTETRLKSLIDAINRAAEDERVTTLVLDLN